MNKKLFLGLLAGAAMLFTACQDEEVKAIADGDTDVTITAELPSGVSTRAFADGTTATKLTYAIYETGQQNALITGTAMFVDLKTTVIARLANGKTYDLLFWAQADGAPYTFDAATQKVTVDYTAAVGQDETRDAFFKAETLTVDGTINKTIQLRRPFAQLNIGAQDFEDAKTAGFEATQTKVTVDNVYTTLNLLTGAVEDQTSVTYGLANLPAEAFPVSVTPAAKYMSMDYLLVAADKELTNVTFTATNGSHDVERHYTNVPVQRNYRTNIYGNILTEEANFNIEIVPDFEAPDYDIVISSESDLQDAAAHGGNAVLANDVTFTSHLIVNSAEPLNLNLNGNSLITTPDNIVYVYGDLNLTNGKVSSTTQGEAYSSVYVGNTGKVTVDNVEFVSDGSLFWVADYSDVTIKNSSLKAQAWCVATNASISTQNPTIFLENCTFESETPVMVNIPSTLTLDGCTLDGRWQGLMVRGGTAVVKNSRINVNYAAADAVTMATKYAIKNWGSGNNVPIAAATFGNRSANSYRYATNVTVENSDFNVQGDNASYFPAVYIYANVEEGQGVTFNYDSNTTFNGGAKAIAVGSNNVTINGSTATITE
ncbi:MAG: DUF6562 domain-containing protein [Candidatus Limisoma sp.]